MTTPSAESVALEEAHKKYRIRYEPGFSPYADYRDIPDDLKDTIKASIRTKLLKVCDKGLDLATEGCIYIEGYYKHKLTYTVDGEERPLYHSFIVGQETALAEVLRKLLDERGIDRKFCVFRTSSKLDGLVIAAFIL